MRGITLTAPSVSTQPPNPVDQPIDIPFNDVGVWDVSVKNPGLVVNEIGASTHFTRYDLDIAVGYVSELCQAIGLY